LFEPFSLKNGRPLIAGKGGAGGGKTPNSRTSRSSSSSRVTNTRSSSPTAERSGNGPGAVSAVSAPKNGSKGGAGSRDRDIPPITLRRGQQQNNGQFHIDRGFSAEDDKKEVRAQKKLDAKNSKSNGNRKIAFTVTDPRKAGFAPNDKEVELGFGDYLRYLIIAAIVIAIVIVLGGQLMQVRRNQNVE
jgi:hypothetical protein